MCASVQQKPSVTKQNSSGLQAAHCEPSGGWQLSHSNAGRAVGNGRGHLIHAAAAGKSSEKLSWLMAVDSLWASAGRQTGPGSVAQREFAILSELQLNTASSRTVTAGQDMEVSKAIQVLHCHKVHVRLMVGLLL